MKGIMDSEMDEQQLDYLLRFWEYLPAAAAIKEVHGRVIFANPEFRRIVGWQEVTGALPTDYFKTDPEVAIRVMAHDRAALEYQKPILSVDEIPVGGVWRDRLAIRFPIFDRGHLRVEMTGVVGFDLEQVEAKAHDLRPDGWEGFDFESEKPPFQNPIVQESIPASMLRAFIYNLPGILTVKESDSKLLFANAEYTRVTGRQRSEVIGRRPSENWPGKLGTSIEDRDLEVKTHRKAIMSVESLPTREHGIQERLNIRFPL